MDLICGNLLIYMASANYRHVLQLRYRDGKRRAGTQLVTER